MQNPHLSCLLSTLGCWADASYWSDFSSFFCWKKTIQLKPSSPEGQGLFGEFNFSSSKWNKSIPTPEEALCFRSQVASKCRDGKWTSPWMGDAGTVSCKDFYSSLSAEWSFLNRLKFEWINIYLWFYMCVCVCAQLVKLLYFYGFTWNCLTIVADHGK